MEDLIGRPSTTRTITKIKLNERGKEEEEEEEEAEKQTQSNIKKNIRPVVFVYVESSRLAH